MIKLVFDILETYLPSCIFKAIEPYADKIAEVRIRRCKQLALTVLPSHRGVRRQGDNLALPLVINDQLMDETVSLFCEHSLYSHMETMIEGYIPLKEGYRVGVCGRAVTDKNGIAHLSSVDGINVRIPHRFRGIAKELYRYLKKGEASSGMLIYSPPNMGKTTILRDIIEELASDSAARRVSVVDSRCEIETEWLHTLPHLDFLSAYPRAKGIEIATRTLSPEYIVCDEIGGYEEATALLSAQNCGVPIIATAHAASLDELLARQNVALLHQHGLFSYYVGIKRIDRQGQTHFRISHCHNGRVTDLPTSLVVCEV